MWVYSRHLFLVADELNQSISYAANFGSCFLGFVFARWSTSLWTSLLLMFEIVDNTDNDFDTADIDDGDDVDKNSVNEREDTVKGVEHNGGNSTAKEPMRGDTICFVVVVFNADLPTIAFLRGVLWIFAMVAIMLIDISIKKYGQRVR